MKTDIGEAAAPPGSRDAIGSRRCAGSPASPRGGGFISNYERPYCIAAEVSALRRVCPYFQLPQLVANLGATMLVVLGLFERGQK
jgi:hypothetical protein